MNKKMFVVMVSFLCVLLPFAQAEPAETGKEITVSVAASLKNAFTELGKLFEEKNKGTSVQLNFGGSGKLARQIEGGAPVDVFASASLVDMDEIDSKGLVIKGSRINFARISLVLITPKNSKIVLSSFDDLRKPGVKRIAIGNTRNVPAGRYAEEALRYYNLFDLLKPKYVLAETCRQVLDYVARGEVEAGLVYLTDAMTRPEEVNVALQAPEESHKPVIYSIGVIAGSKNEDLAKAFTQLVASEEGMKILRKSGFQSYGK